MNITHMTVVDAHARQHANKLLFAFLEEIFYINSRVALIIVYNISVCVLCVHLSIFSQHEKEAVVYDEVDVSTTPQGPSGHREKDIDLHSNDAYHPMRTKGIITAHNQAYGQVHL